MNTLKNSIVAIAMSGTLVTTAWAGTVNPANMHTFTSGAPAVAADVNANFTELTTQVNDNASRLDPTKRLLRNSLLIRVPNLALGNTGQTDVSVILSNATSTACAARTAFASRFGNVGTNTYSILFPGAYTTSNLPATTTNTAPSTTKSLILRSYSFNAQALTLYTDVVIYRNTSDALDTCTDDGVEVLGVWVSYPNSSQGWVPASQMQ